MMMCRVSVMYFTPFSVPLKCVTSSSSSESCAVLCAAAVLALYDVCAGIAGFGGRVSPALTNGIGLKAGLDDGVVGA